MSVSTPRWDDPTRTIASSMRVPLASIRSVLTRFRMILLNVLPLEMQVPGEVELKPKYLTAGDGNMSMRHTDGAGHADARRFPSKYFLTSERVAKFERDVAEKPGLKEAAAEARAAKQAAALSALEGVNLESNQPVDALAQQRVGVIKPCVDNWTAANAVKEGTNKVFDVTGGYLTACRHGLILSVIEMIKSGELYVGAYYSPARV